MIMIYQTLSRISGSEKIIIYIVCDGEDSKFFDHWINADYKEGKVCEINLDEIEKWLNE